MGWTVAPVRPSVVLHSREDPGIAEFVPHVPVTDPDAAPHGWCIEPALAPLSWFPRDRARVTVRAHDAEGQWVVASGLPFSIVRWPARL